MALVVPDVFPKTNLSNKACFCPHEMHAMPVHMEECAVGSGMFKHEYFLL